MIQSQLGKLEVKRLVDFIINIKPTILGFTDINNVLISISFVSYQRSWQSVRYVDSD
ncbi:Uncharacterised protein [Salmonella enterica subsp. enterica serovar Dublin]|nr:Uncharacterised protein [Salmonella enterica subsp. enterica serovar Dublin]